VHGGEDRERDNAAQVIVLPRRELALGEQPDHPPAEVIEFPVRPGERPPDAPPRLAI